MKFSKRGISPLIATVLLIGFTIVLAALVMRWGGTLFRETTQTTGCESQGRIACSSQVDISVGDVQYYTNNTAPYNRVSILVVNNLAATQSIDALNVQRELNDGSIENVKVTISQSLSAGNSIAFTSPPNPYVPQYNTYSPSANLRSIHITPIFTQTTSDGGSCRIVCSEQKETIINDGTRINVIG